MADQGAEGLLSPYLRRERIRRAVPYLKGRVLDFGCGSGTLAAHIDADCYLGVERDTVSLQIAREHFSIHTFVPELSEITNKFDTVVSLAVIEHVKNPVEFLRTLAAYLDDNPASNIIITTPHPSVDWVHHLGASLGLFSKHASEEHEDLLDRSRLEEVGREAGLSIIDYSRFLFGANQIAVFAKDRSRKEKQFV
ncbi:class I SAM-dependent methyltransferase [Sodalis sp. RH16]|jgi:2-polyprenyl-3-methyl-5-hydroxy-6-metoxy-1,4-benzoquinol methylase|uniref:class I SAM-dependent methyltransferase n=1 Tax=unclassified Sodalis (in: enterobacteria) TaxID=2636512 RepID=UPI0039B41401